MEKTKEDRCHIDSIYKEIGQFGRYQLCILSILMLPFALSSAVGMTYVFAAGDLNYRCAIPELDNNNRTVYNPSWISEAVPMMDDGKPIQCLRYEPIEEGFNQSSVLKCDNFVYETGELTILNEFNLQCDENKWKLAMVGTMRSIGCFVNLMVVGSFADKYGRKPVLIISALFTIIFGYLKTLAWNYSSFLIGEFVDSVMGNGMYISGFIIVMEMLGPEYRALGAALSFMSGPVSKSILGILAMYLLDWKWIIRSISIFSLLMLSLFWILPESARWLLINKRFDEAARVLLRAAKFNGKTVSPETLDLLNNHPQDIKLDEKDTKVDDKRRNGIALFEAMRYPPFIARMLISSYCFLAIMFIFYGLSLYSVALGGNKFLDFIWVSLIEIPAEILYIFISKMIGRKVILISSFFLTAFSMFGFVMITDMYWIQFGMYLIGKFSISISFVTMYMYVTEFFPTEFRQSMMGLTSAIGRIGAMVAPQATVIALYWKPLPLVLFGGSSIIAGGLCYFLPETYGKNLPNTIQDALELGKFKVVKK